MTIKTAVKANWKADKIKLQNEISSLKENMTRFKAERKLTWKSFKNKFNDDLKKVELSLKQLSGIQKK